MALFILLLICLYPYFKQGVDELIADILISIAYIVAFILKIILKIYRLCRPKSKNKKN